MFSLKVVATGLVAGLLSAWALGSVHAAEQGKFFRIKGSCQIVQRVKGGAPRMSYNAALMALRQCGKPIGKPLDILAANGRRR